MDSIPFELSLTGLVEVLDSLREGIQILDPDFRYIYVNEAVCRHGKLTKADLVGRTMQECYPGIEATETFTFLEQNMKNQTRATRRNEFTYPDGSRGMFELRVEPCRAGLVVLSIDVTPESRLEAQLLQAQKMEALGRLAGGVAHDFNNLLSVILSFSELSLDSLPPGHPLRRDIEPILGAAKKAAHLTQQLLSFSRHRAQLAESLSLNHTIELSRPILQRLVGDEVDLVFHLTTDLGSVDLDPAQADQLLLNLVINAKDAMPNGGRIVVETSNIELDEPLDSDTGVLEPGSYVQLAVTDAGVGIEPALRSRIFEPFFTTKGGRGTGLGLSIVFGIVRRALGGIWLYSEVQKGSTFRIYLPRSSSDNAAPSEPELLETLRGTETLLVVDDDDGVRSAVTRVLENFGYTVVPARDADEALDIWRTRRGEIELLLTDIVLPERDGIQLAQEIRTDRPRLPVVFMSGYAEHALDELRRATHNTGYLSKPILPRALASKIRKTLAQVKPE